MLDCFCEMALDSFVSGVLFPERVKVHLLYMEVMLVRYSTFLMLLFILTDSPYKQMTFMYFCLYLLVCLFSFTLRRFRCDVLMNFFDSVELNN